jgi:hypothetical protein
MAVTTLYTVDGPTVRTIWTDVDNPKHPMTVDRVEKGRVHFKESMFKSISLISFRGHVVTGRYILIGVEPFPLSHTEV